jgi:hypothetical protein
MTRFERLIENGDLILGIAAVIFIALMVAWFVVMLPVAVQS